MKITAYCQFCDEPICFTLDEDKDKLEQSYAKATTTCPMCFTSYSLKSLLTKFDAIGVHDQMDVKSAPKGTMLSTKDMRKHRFQTCYSSSYTTPEEPNHAGNTAKKAQVNKRKTPSTRKGNKRTK